MLRARARVRPRESGRFARRLGRAGSTGRRTRRGRVARATSTSPACVVRRTRASRDSTETACVATAAPSTRAGGATASREPSTSRDGVAEGALDAGGFCCASGTFDACGACDGDGSSCPVWLELRLSLPASVVDDGEEAMHAHVAEWATHALNLSSVVETDAGGGGGSLSGGGVDPERLLAMVRGSAATGALGSAVMAPPPPRREPPPPPVPPGRIPVGDAAVPAAVPAAVAAAVPAPVPAVAARTVASSSSSATNDAGAVSRRGGDSREASVRPGGGPEEDGVGPRRATRSTRRSRVRRAGERERRDVGHARVSRFGRGARGRVRKRRVRIRRDVRPRRRTNRRSRGDARRGGCRRRANPRIRHVDGESRRRQSRGGGVRGPSGTRRRRRRHRVLPRGLSVSTETVPRARGVRRTVRRTRQMPPGRRTVRLFPGTRVDGRGVRRVRRGVLRQPAGGVREAIGAARAAATESAGDVARRAAAAGERRPSVVGHARARRPRRECRRGDALPGKRRAQRCRASREARLAIQTSMGTRRRRRSRRRVFPFQTGGFVSRPARHPDDERVAGRGHTVGVPIDASALDALDVRVDVRPRRSKGPLARGRGGAESDSFDDRFEELDAFGNRRNAHGVGRRGRALDRGGVVGPSGGVVVGPSGERRARDGFDGFDGFESAPPFARTPPDGHRSSVRREDASDFAGSAEFTRDGTIRVRIWIRTRVFARGASARTVSTGAGGDGSGETGDAARIGDARVRAGGESRSDDDARRARGRRPRRDGLGQRRHARVTAGGGLAAIGENPTPAFDVRPGTAFDPEPVNAGRWPNGGGADVRRAEAERFAAARRDAARSVVERSTRGGFDERRRRFDRYRRARDEPPVVFDDGERAFDPARGRRRDERFANHHGE